MNLNKLKDLEDEGVLDERGVPIEQYAEDERRPHIATINRCIDDLKKFYGYTNQLNTPVNLGRRGDSLAGNILRQYTPYQIAEAFTLLPLVLKTSKDERVKDYERNDKNS